MREIDVTSTVSSWFIYGFLHSKYTYHLEQFVLIIFIIINAKSAVMNFIWESSGPSLNLLVNGVKQDIDPKCNFTQTDMKQNSMKMINLTIYCLFNFRQQKKIDGNYWV